MPNVLLIVDTFLFYSPDRLPYYERVFMSALSVQTPRYNADLAIPPPGMKVRLPPAQLSSHEMNMLRDLTVLSRIQTVQKQVSFQILAAS